MYTLLIADSSEPYTDALKRVLGSEFELHICRDGDSALHTLNSLRPQVLLINLMLPYKDGLTVLRESQYKPPVILAISPLVNPYVEKAALAVGVQYLMILPSIRALRLRLMDMVAATIAPRDDITVQTVVLLHELDFATHLDGYRQLCFAIPLYGQNPELRLSKELYPAVAKQFGLSDARTVEHSIRKAVSSAWLNMDRTVWARYFPPEPDGVIPCPSNKSFISRLAQMLEL